MVALCHIWMDRGLVGLNTLRSSVWGNCRQHPTVGLQIVYNDPSINKTPTSLDEVTEAVILLRGGKKAGVSNIC